jgi:hypothetical protein
MRKVGALTWETAAKMLSAQQIAQRRTGEFYQQAGLTVLAQDSGSGDGRSVRISSATLYP